MGTRRTDGRTGVSDRPPEAAALRLLRLGFGGLWLVDGLLQVQPGMFTMDMVSTVMQPAATGEPAWLSATIAWSIRLVTPHIALVNALIVALQIAIGLLLLIGGRPRLVRAGAFLGLAWALVVWLFGEGLGQVLTGTATAMTGAPGSALLYALASAVLLLAPTAGGEVRIAGRSAVTWLVAGLFALGAVLQLNPLFFTPLGLSTVFAQGATMAQPWLLRLPLVWATNLSANHPVVTNGVLVAAFALAGLAALAVPWTARGRAGHVLLLVVLAFVAVQWWFGQDLGMPFSGMATDPNSAVPLALLFLAGRRADLHLEARRRAAAAAAEAQAAPPLGA